ncbi:MAG: DEAD/DEAH box helicase [Bacteroidetes bacterium]|nr:DEAD/DEAH box helicase [Bacteroidota bacterium]
MKDFERLGLSLPLVERIEELGFISPTEIQTKAIPTLLEKSTDLVGLAQTGTGKTAAFGLPLIDLVETEKKYTQALVLAPTRELCVQIARELDQFSSHLRDLRISAVYGGADIVKQIREVKRGVHILVATPGRLRDLIRRNVVDLSRLGYLVLDEADEMLNMGFKEEIDDILQSVPEEKLTWLFSATMPDEVSRIANAYMNSPVKLSVGEKNTANEDIDHQFVFARPSEKYEILRRFLDVDGSMFGLIFTRTRRDAKELADQLMQDGYNADALHGDMNQIQRDRVMARFRLRQINILVATDVAARGIDVKDISHVFHYNLSDDISLYTHRSGRTARAGNTGISLILLHPRDKYLLGRLEKKVGIRITKARIPTGREICESRLIEQIQGIRNAEVSDEIRDFLPEILEELEGLSKEELVLKIASLSFSDFLKTYRNAPDLNGEQRREKSGKKSSSDDKRERGGKKNKKHRLFINIGSMDIDNTAGFISLICEYSQIRGQAIGKIDLHEKHTFFEVEESEADLVVSAFEGSIMDGRPIRVNGLPEGKKKLKKRRHKKRR